MPENRKALAVGLSIPLGGITSLEVMSIETQSPTSAPPA